MRIAVLGAAIILAGCVDVPKYHHTTEEIVIVRAFDPPKHVRVDLEFPSTGQVVTASISKHCNNWRSRYTALRGKRIRVLIDYSRDKRGRETFQVNKARLRHIFCGGY